MAQETTYSCDRCGKTIVENEDESTKRYGNIVAIRIHTSEARNGDLYSAQWHDLDESWELCMPCGREIRKAMKEAMTDA